MDQLNIQEIAFIDMIEICSLTKVSRSQIYKLISQKRFPAPIDLSTGKSYRCSRWLLSEVNEWFLEKLDERAA